MKLRRMNRIAVAGALALVAATAVPVARAEEKAPAWLRASFLLNTCQKFADDMGLPIPFDKELRQDLERAPFMGPGSMAVDKPMGVQIFPENPNEGERFDRSVERGVVVAIPVNKGFAPLENLIAFAKERDAGAAVAGDTITSRGMNIRRLADYILASPGPHVVQGTNDAYKDDYRKAGTLASATLDLATLRKHAPKFVDAFWAEAKREVRGNGPEDKMALMAIDTMRKHVDAVNTVAAAISKDDKSLRATAVVSPMDIKPTLPAMARPTFPAGTMLQVHVAYPNAQMVTWAADAIAKVDLKEIAGRDLSEKELAEATDVKALALRAAKLFSAEAQSLGVVMDSGKPILLVVNQYSKAPDVAAGFKALAGDVNAARKKQGRSKAVEIEEYSAGGQTVVRALLLDNEQPMCYIDVAQAGNKVAMSISEGKVEKVAGLLAAPAKGEISDFIQASVDLGEVFKAAEGMLPIPDQMAAKIRAAVTDKSVSLVVKSTDNGKSMLAEVTVPVAVLKDLGEVFRGMMGGNGAGPAHINSEPMPAQQVDQ